MATPVEDFIATIRGSVIGQLNSANSLYDAVSNLAEIAELLPPEANHLKERLNAEALSIYKVASSLSESASKVGTDLAQIVSR